MKNHFLNTSKYPILNSIYIETSILQANPLQIINKIEEFNEKHASCILEDNKINMDIEYRGGRSNNNSLDSYGGSFTI